VCDRPYFFRVDIYLKGTAMKMIVIVPTKGDDKKKMEALIDRILGGRKPSDLLWGFFGSNEPHVASTLRAVRGRLADQDVFFKEKVDHLPIDRLTVTKRAQIKPFAKHIHGQRVLDHNAVNLIVVGPNIVNRLVPALTWEKVNCERRLKPLEGYVVHINGFVRPFVC
jgi:hypothetical protein